MRKFFLKKFIFLNIFFAGVLVCGYAAETAPANLIFLSDIHCNTSEIQCQKIGLITQIIKEITTPGNNVKAVVFPGDLTSNGSDDEFKVFADLCLRPISQTMPTLPHCGLYLCNGNHDESSGSNSQLMKYLKGEYGNDIRYSFDVNGLHVICCGKYPNKSACVCARDTMAWLQADLQDVGTHQPVVIFFHFNIMGPFSDWWKKSEKDLLFEMLKNYNVKCIFFGHIHYSFSMLWRDSIRVAGVGGDAYAFCTYNSAARGTDREFVLEFKNASGFFVPYDPRRLTGEFKEEG